MGSQSNYKGFVAGVFSGVAKLTVGHPFDTIKVRLQTSDSTRFSGPLQCLLQTVRKEGVAGLYKGATPPLVGWMFMDSLMLGSLTYYRNSCIAPSSTPTEWPPPPPPSHSASAAKTVYKENGVKGYWRGFVPCFLRAFPANAMALVAFEGVMRALP